MNTEKSTQPDADAPSLLLVESNEFIRTRLHDWLAVQFPDVRFLWARNFEQACELAARFKPSVALVDVDIPDAEGFQVLRLLSALVPDTYLIALSMYHSDTYRPYATAAGAIACLSLHMSDSMLRNLVGLVLKEHAESKAARG